MYFKERVVRCMRIALVCLEISFCSFALPLPAGKNCKAIADNFITSMALLCKLKMRGILYVGTVRNNQFLGCELKEEKTLKKEGRGNFDHRVETTHNICTIRWFDKRDVALVSSYL